MLNKIKLKKQPDEHLIIDFITRISPALADSILVRFITYEMGQKLRKQREKGFKDWNTPQIENKDLIDRLKKNLEQEDYIDVVNLAAMLHARKQMFDEIHFTKYE